MIYNAFVTEVHFSICPLYHHVMVPTVNKLDALSNAKFTPFKPHVSSHVARFTTQTVWIISLKSKAEVTVF